MRGCTSERKKQMLQLATTDTHRHEVLVVSQLANNEPIEGVGDGIQPVHPDPSFGYQRLRLVESLQQAPPSRHSRKRRAAGAQAAKPCGHASVPSSGKAAAASSRSATHAEQVPHACGSGRRQAEGSSGVCQKVWQANCSVGSAMCGTAGLPGNGSSCCGQPAVHAPYMKEVNALAMASEGVIWTLWMPKNVLHPKTDGALLGPCP